MKHAATTVFFRGCNIAAAEHLECGNVKSEDSLSLAGPLLGMSMRVRLLQSYTGPHGANAGDMGQTPGTISPAPVGYVVAGKIRFYE